MIQKKFTRIATEEYRKARREHTKRKRKNSIKKNYDWLHDCDDKIERI